MTDAERMKRLEKEMQLRVGYGMPDKASDDEASDAHNSSSKKKPPNKASKKGDGANSALKQTTLVFRQNPLAGSKRSAPDYQSFESD